MDLKFDVTFHGPFRVSTGAPGASGADDGVDLSDPLPGTSLKGALRATAISLGCPMRLVDEVFGTTRKPSPWYFSGTGSWSWRGGGTDPRPLMRARVAIDDDLGVAQNRALHLADELWPTSATFHIDLIGSLDDDELDAHRLVLLLASAGTKAVGADRRRGLGWVTIAMSDADTDDLNRAVELIGGTTS